MSFSFHPLGWPFWERGIDVIAAICNRQPVKLWIFMACWCQSPRGVIEIGSMTMTVIRSGWLHNDNGECKWERGWCTFQLLITGLIQTHKPYPSNCTDDKKKYAYTCLDINMSSIANSSSLPPICHGHLGGRELFPSENLLYLHSPKVTNGTAQEVQRSIGLAWTAQHTSTNGTWEPPKGTIRRLIRP